LCCSPQITGISWAITARPQGDVLYDALLHVPMIWHVPEFPAAARARGACAGHRYFSHSGRLTGGKPDDSLMGRSLKPILAGNDRSDASRTIFTSAGTAKWPRELVESNRLRSADPALPLHTLVEDVASSYSTVSP